MALSLRQGPDASPISNSFLFSSPEYDHHLIISNIFSSFLIIYHFSTKVKLILECVIHTDSSAEPAPSESTPASPPQFISSANFRMLRGLPPPSPNLARRSLRSSLRSSAPLRGSTNFSLDSSTGLPPHQPQQQQQQQERNKEKELSASQSIPRGRPRSTPSV